MAETFKRYGSGTTVHGVECGPSEEVTGTFGIPLELLPPSLVNEVSCCYGWCSEHLLSAAAFANSCSLNAGVSCEIDIALKVVV